MASTATRSAAPRFEAHERPSKPRQPRTEIWTSLLKQTQIAQSRDRSNAVAHRQVLLCGGSSDDQRSFLNSLTRPPPPQPLRRNRNEKFDVKEKGALALSNRYAYGYGHLSLFSAQQGVIGSAVLGVESEEVARIQCHCIPEPDITYEPVLRRILAEPAVKEDAEHEDEQIGAESTHQGPVVQILLSWKQPWKFLRTLRAWLQLLAKALLAPTVREDDPVEVLKEHDIKVILVVQHVEAQQELEREGWTEERFDYVCQVLRTVLLPLHPNSALIYTPSLLTTQQPGGPLTEIQKVIFAGLNLSLAALSPRPSSSGTGASKKEDLLPRHNVVDRMNIVIPFAWDSAGKVRLLSETFSPEELLTTWSTDLSHNVFPAALVTQHKEEDSQDTQQNQTLSTRQAEEVFAAEPSSPVPSTPSLPPSPSKRTPSAIHLYEEQIEDPNAHKAPKPPAITVTTRPEQDFLKEMKSELDAYNARDREKGPALSQASPARQIVVPSGESTGALDGLGEVSFNVGGVSYNTTSAEAAIERLRRPQPPGVLQDGTTSSPLSGASRTGTPRPLRRFDHSDREGTPGFSTPSSTKADFPSEDLEKYFASLAKKAGGADSRQGTPSRQ